MGITTQTSNSWSALVVIALLVGLSQEVSAAAGDLDTAFNPGSGANNVVNTSVVQAGGKIVIGGDFTTVNGAVRNYITRLNTNGSIDSGFNLAGSGASNIVVSSAVQPNGKIVIAGIFNFYNGAAHSKITRLHADGSLDTGFDAGTNDVIYSIRIQSDDKIVLGGQFLTVNGTAIKGVARLNADGSLDTSFNPGSGVNNYVRTSALQSDGKIVIGGTFTTVNGTAINRIARLNSDGSLDTGFNPGSGVDNVVKTLTLQADDKIIIGGSFATVNGTAINRIARLNTDGSLDTSFNPGSGANGSLGAIALQPNGKIVIGGTFDTVNGAAINRIARLNTDGSLDTTFNPGSGANGGSGTDVNTIVVQADGLIVIGGEFTTYNGIARKRIARLHSGDSDSDGIEDAADIFALDPDESLDTDQDAVGNNADWDDDGDGIPDAIDAAPLDTGNSNEITLVLDSSYKGAAMNSAVSK